MQDKKCHLLFSNYNFFCKEQVKFPDATCAIHTHLHCQLTNNQLQLSIKVMTMNEDFHPIWLVLTNESAIRFSIYLLHHLTLIGGCNLVTCFSRSQDYCKSDSLDVQVFLFVFNDAFLKLPTVSLWPNSVVHLHKSHVVCKITTGFFCQILDLKNDFHWALWE